MQNVKPFRTFDSVTEMIERAEEFGDLSVKINGVHHSLSCSFKKEGDIYVSDKWSWNLHGMTTEEWFNSTEYDSVTEAVNAKVFDGKSLIDLFDEADFTEN